MSAAVRIQPGDEWLTFDEVSARLVLPEEPVARLILAGTLRFEVVKRSPNPNFVLRMDVLVNADDVADLQRERWRTDQGLKADELLNRAALKFGKHPTRTSRGVRGKSKRERDHDGQDRADDA